MQSFIPYPRTTAGIPTLAPHHYTEAAAATIEAIANWTRLQHAVATRIGSKVATTCRGLDATVAAQCQKGAGLFRELLAACIASMIPF